MRVVFDCMLFLQAAARKESPSGLCLDLAWHRHVELCVSQEILDEVANVLARPRIRQKFPALNDVMVAAFLDTVRERSRFFAAVPQQLTLSRDPKDEPYLNLASCSGADYVVSRDTDLLDLDSGTDVESRLVREACPKLRIVDPVVFLALIRNDLASQ